MTIRERMAVRKAALTDRQAAALQALLRDFGYVLEGRKLRYTNPAFEHTLCRDVADLWDAADYLQPILRSDVYYYRLESIRNLK